MQNILKHISRALCEWQQLITNEFQMHLSNKAISRVLCEWQRLITNNFQMRLSNKAILKYKGSLTTILSLDNILPTTILETSQ